MKKKFKKERKEKCQICFKSFASQDSMEEHFKKYHENGEFKCHICQATFTFTNYLRSHMKSAHEGIVLTPNFDFMSKNLKKKCFFCRNKSLYQVFNYILKPLYFFDLTRFRPLGQNQANVFVSFWKKFDTTNQK